MMHAKLALSKSEDMLDGQDDHKAIKAEYIRASAFKMNPLLPRLHRAFGIVLGAVARRCIMQAKAMQ